MHRTASIRPVVAEKQNIRVIPVPAIGLSSAHNPFLLTNQQEEGRGFRSTKPTKIGREYLAGLIGRPMGTSGLLRSSGEVSGSR